MNFPPPAPPHSHAVLHVFAIIAGENGKRIRELTRIVQKRFGFDDNTVELFAERVAEKGLCAQAQAEALKCVPDSFVCACTGCLGVCCEFVRVSEYVCMLCAGYLCHDGLRVYICDRVCVSDVPDAS